jgi:hypothetical protein
MVDERHTSFSIGAPESDAQLATRAVLGEATPERMALAEVFKAHEAELTEWLREPGNRERLMADPITALSEVIPPELLKVIEKPPRVRAGLIKQLAKLEPRTAQPPKTPAQDLFDKVWAFVAGSAANLAAFTADMEGTVRGVDPTAPAAAVDEVIAALDLVRGIHHLQLVDAGHFAGAVNDFLSTGTATTRTVRP